jgi:hypothetical protein
MNMDLIPIWALLVVTVIIVMASVEGGRFFGRSAQRQVHKEKVPPVSSIVASTLGLLTFMLAFTFGMVASRFDARKTLVRDEANVVRTAWLRSDFLPEPDRSEAAALIKTYVDRRISAVESHDRGVLENTLAESAAIQHRLWKIAVTNGRREMNSPVAALYLTSLNQMIDMHALRVVIGLEARVPFAIWLALYSLIVLGMIGVGYQAVIAESTGRSLAPLMLAFSFAVVIALIGALDRPASGLVVSQQPLKDARIWMESGTKADSSAAKP